MTDTPPLPPLKITFTLGDMCEMALREHTEERQNEKLADAYEVLRLIREAEGRV